MSELLGSRLVDAGVITADQLTEALERQHNYGGRLASICLHMGFADERSLAIVLSRHIGMPFVVLSRSAVPVAMGKELPFAAASKLLALPLRRDGRSLLVALASPKDVAAVDQLRFGTGARLVEYGALALPLHNAIQRVYSLQGSQGPALLEGEHLDHSQIVGEVGYLEVVQGTEDVQGPARSVTSASTPLADLMGGWGEEAVVSQPTSQGPTTVLVVDDEVELRTMLCEYLRRQGYRTLEAGDGGQALQVLQQELPHLIVLDAMLPGVHGFEICHQVKHAAATRHIHVIMISAVYRGWRYADDVKKLYGADAFLEKPFRLDELKKAIDGVLDGQQQAAEPEQISAQAQTLLRQAADAYRAGNPQQSAELLEQAVAQAPFSVDLHQRLGALYEQLNQVHRAIPARERVAELAPSYPHLLALAQLYERAGFRHKAFEAWERCFWLCEVPEEADKIRARMQTLLPDSK